MRVYYTGAYKDIGDISPDMVCDFICVKGRGTCILASRKLHGTPPDLGEHVMVNDEECIVTGLDASWKLLSPPILGDGVGIYVRTV
jgi:hypothetical protein